MTTRVADRRARHRDHQARACRGRWKPAGGPCVVGPALLNGTSSCTGFNDGIVDVDRRAPAGRCTAGVPRRCRPDVRRAAGGAERGHHDLLGSDRHRARDGPRHRPPRSAGRELAVARPRPSTTPRPRSSLDGRGFPGIHRVPAGRPPAHRRRAGVAATGPRPPRRHPARHDPLPRAADTGRMGHGSIRGGAHLPGISRTLAWPRPSAVVTRPSR